MPAAQSLQVLKKGMVINMNEENENKGFSYTYSSGEWKQIREEVERIRSQYIPKDVTESKLEKILLLDKKAKTPALITAMALGCTGTLVFGGGLSLILVYYAMISGIILGILGGIMIAAAYPCHQAMLKKGKKKYATEIIMLSNELLHDKMGSALKDEENF